MDLRYLPPKIYGRKPISIRCNRIEHWVYLRCAGIRLAQYADTWTCHIHKESRLTTHTNITPHHLPRLRPLALFPQRHQPHVTTHRNHTCSEPHTSISVTLALCQHTHTPTVTQGPVMRSKHKHLLIVRKKKNGSRHKYQQ